MSVPAPRPPQDAPEHRTLADATAACNAWIEVDGVAIAHNVAAIRTWVGPSVDVIAVVKANVYGHGAREAAPLVEAAGADRLATVWVSEAVRLRRAGVTRPILVLGHAFPEDAEDAVAHDLIVTVNDRPLADALSAAAQAQGRTARVHLKVDTGLRRFGVDPHEAVALAEEMRCLPGLEVEGLWTHMANADEEDDGFGEEQAARFEAVARDLSWIPYRHVANSATALRRPALRHHGIRIGLGAWGYRPAAWVPGPELEPALSLRARIARTIRVAPGEGVAYGHTWRAARPSVIGLVPVGYGDGWRRDLGNRGAVLVRGQRVPIVGRVMMDHFCVDLTDVDGARDGEVVTLIGRDGDERIGADEVADLLGTIPYEVLSTLQARLPRFPHRRGVLTASC